MHQSRVQQFLCEQRPGRTLIFVPLFNSSKFFGSRSRLDGGSRAWGSTRKMTPEAFRLNGVFETDRKYGPVEAIGIELRNR